MLKKIRCIYWSMRDRGKGKQAIATGIILILTIGLLLASAIKDFVSNKKSDEAPNEIGVSASAVSGTSIATDGAISEGEEDLEQVPKEAEQNVPTEMDVDISGLDAFHGFMSDEAYAKMEDLAVQECRSRNCNAIKKLEYQQTKKETFDVVSFLLLSDGSIVQCNYNLKSTVVSIVPTSYTEADITSFRENEKKEEQEKIEKQRKAEQKKKKQQAAKKKKSKKKSKAKKKKTAKKRKK